MFWKLDTISLLGEMEENGSCCPKEEYSWMKVVRPIGYDGGLEVGLIVDVDGSLGSLLCSCISNLFV